MAAVMPALGIAAAAKDTPPLGYGVDELLGDIHVRITESSDFVSAYTLGALGQILMPFVEEPSPYIPAAGEANDKGQSSDPKKKKPAVMKEEAETLNKQLRESGFMGTSHLPVEFAGVMKNCSENLFRLNHRLENTKAELKKKYPKGTFQDKGKGRFEILPVYKAGGKKVKEPQTLAPKPPGKIGEAAYDASLHEAWQKMKKRADKIRIDNKEEKTGLPMKKELLTLKRTIKDLESLSEVERAASRRDAESGKVLPRGELIQIKMKLDKEKKKYPNPKSIAETLIENGADINDANPDGFTALMYASRNGHYDTAKHLMTMPGIDRNQCNKLGCNAMHYAAQNAHKEMVELLKKSGGVNRKALSLVLKTKHSPFRRR